MWPLKIEDLKAVFCCVFCCVFSPQLLSKIETKPGYFPWLKTAKKIDQKSFL